VRKRAKRVAQTVTIAESSWSNCSTRLQNFYIIFAKDGKDDSSKFLYPFLIFILILILILFYSSFLIILD